MDIEKYKAELEAAIYEGPDGRFYIGGMVVEKVLLEAQNQALHIHGVGCMFYCQRWDVTGSKRCEKQCEVCKPDY